jgi:hypothetical protein
MSEANSRPIPDTLEEATRALREVPTPAGPPAELTAATTAEVKNRLAGTAPASAVARQKKRRRIMRYVGFGSATAAAIAVATAAALIGFGGNSAAAGFRKALDNAKEAKSVRILSRDPAGKADLTLHIQGDRIRVDEPGADFPVRIWDLSAKQELILDPPAKTARLKAMTQEDLRKATDERSRIFNLLPTLRAEEGVKVKELPEEKVGGRTTKVFEFSSEDSSGRLWVDAKSNLPVRLKLATKFLSSQLEIDLEFVDWNVEFDAKLFSLEVPAGYKLLDEKK